MTAFGPNAAPQFLWFIGDTPQEIRVEWYQGTTPVLAYWGQDDLSDIIPGGQLVSHTYPSMGAYNLRVHEMGGEQALITQVQIVIRNGRPNVQITQDLDDPTALVARFPALDDTKIVPTFRIYWEWPGSPTITDDVLGVPGTTFTRRNLTAGPDTIRITDLTSKWWVERDIDVPGRSIDFTLTEIDPTTRKVRLAITKSNPGKHLIVEWGDTGIVETMGSTSHVHYYPAKTDPTTYLAQVAYSDLSDATAKPITIPGGSS